MLYIGTLCTFSANPNGKVVRFGIQMARLCELQGTNETGGAAFFGGHSVFSLGWEIASSEQCRQRKP